LSLDLLGEAKRRLDAGDPSSIRALGEIYWQERREYGPAGGRETAARIESLVRDALGEKSAVGRLVQDVIATAREAGEGVEPKDPPLSARRERILAEPDPLVDELLPDLNDTPWPSLDHAYPRNRYAAPPPAAPGRGRPRPRRRAGAHGRVPFPPWIDLLRDRSCMFPDATARGR